MVDVLLYWFVITVSISCWVISCSQTQSITHDLIFCCFSVFLLKKNTTISYCVGRLVRDNTVKSLAGSFRVHQSLQPMMFCLIVSCTQNSVDFYCVFFLFRGLFPHLNLDKVQQARVIPRHLHRPSAGVNLAASFGGGVLFLSEGTDVHRPRFIEASELRHGNRLPHTQTKEKKDERRYKAKNEKKKTMWEKRKKK